MSQANVRSIDAIREFRLALLTFAEDARVALSAMDMEIRQVRNWLERDQLTYWKAQIKRCQEDIAEARTELHRRQLSQVNSDAVSDSDQKEALRKAKRRLEHAEEMVERIKKWVPVFEHAMAEYHSQSQPLSDRLSGGLVNSLAVLDRMVTVLDEYVAMQAPAAPVLPPTAGSPSEEAGAPARVASEAETRVTAGDAGRPGTAAEADESGQAAFATAEASASAETAESNGEVQS